MAMPHADDPSGGTSRRPDQNDQSRIQPTGGNIPGFTIVDTVIDTREVKPREYFSGPAQIQPALPQDLLKLGRVAGNAH
jgi:hypothetical protein